MLAGYLGATLMTGAHFMGDTVVYVNAVWRGELLEFGHLLFFLLAWTVSRAVMLISGLYPWDSIMLVLLALSWLGGLAAVVLLHSLVRHVARREAVALLVTLGLIFAHAFLNYAQSGTSYIPGLALLLGGLRLMVPRDPGGIGPGRAVAAGVLLGMAVGFWVPFVLAVPAVLLAPLFLAPTAPGRAGSVIRAGAGLGSTLLLLFGGAAAVQGYFTVAAWQEWIAASGHGITEIGGFRRMVFGFARSFLFMGDQGALFKRYLLGDPWNPVSLSSLGLSVSKLLLFYGFLGLMVLELLRAREGRRMLALLALAAVPVLGFAWFWQGGDLERYLPLYPFLFLGVAWFLAHGRWRLADRVLGAIGLAAVMLLNTSAMAKPVLAQRQDAVVARLGAVEERWKPASLLVVPTNQDEIFGFFWNFPLHPINRARGLTVTYVIEPGTDLVPVWRQNIRTRIADAWGSGGDVWLSRRLFAERPEAHHLATVEADETAARLGGCRHLATRSEVYIQSQCVFFWQHRRIQVIPSHPSIRPLQAMGCA